MRVGAKHWVSLSRLIRDVLAQCFALSGMCWPNLMVGDGLGMCCANGWGWIGYVAPMVGDGLPQCFALTGAITIRRCWQSYRVR